MVSLGLICMNFLHRHHVTWTWQRYHQHLRQGVCIIYIKYIPWKKYHRKKCQLNNRQKNNKFNMIGWHNDWYAPQSTQDFSMHGFFDTQFIRNEVQNHRSKDIHLVTEEKNTQNWFRSFLRYTTKAYEEKNSYVKFTHMKLGIHEYKILD